MAYAKSMYALALILASQDKHQAAEDFLRQALDELKEPLSYGGLQLKEKCQLVLAEILAKFYVKLGEAEQILQQIVSSPVDTRDKARVNARSMLARVLAMQSRYSEAEEILRHLLNGPEEISERMHVSISRTLGQVLCGQGRYAEAEIEARRAIENVHAHGPADIKLQIAMLSLGTIKLAQKAYGEAASILRTACDAIASPYHLAHLNCLRKMGRALRLLENHDEAMSFYTRALKGHVQIHGADHQLTRKVSEEIDKYRAFLAEKNSDRGEA
jgi:tetratricopeptide (TPR) repeat protein